MLVTALDWPTLVGFGAGLAAALLLGAVVELAIIRRFFRSPRLILTVATIGLAQLLVVCGAAAARGCGASGPSTLRLHVAVRVHASRSRRSSSTPTTCSP